MLNLRIVNTVSPVPETTFLNKLRPQKLVSKQEKDIESVEAVEGIKFAVAQSKQAQEAQIS